MRAYYNPSTPFSLDHALHYGHGVFETMPCVGDEILLLSEHLERMARGAEILDIPFDYDEILLSINNHLMPSNTASVVKVILTAGGATRGYGGYWQDKANTALNSKQPECQLLVFQDRFSERNLLLRECGARLLLCTTRLGSQPLLAGFKHLNRLEQVLASREVVALGADDGVMLDMAGHLVCTTCANLFWVQSGCLYTPDISECGIAGVFRKKILDLAANLDIPTKLVKTFAADLLEADEVFLSNSVRGIWPVVQVGDSAFHIGELTRLLQSHARPWMAVVSG